MEDGLGGIETVTLPIRYEVLILVLVEDGLGALLKVPLIVKEECLNPCFSGGWSRRI